MGAGGQEDSCSRLVSLQKAGLRAEGSGWCQCSRLVSAQQAGLHAAGWFPCSRLVILVHYYHRACLLYYQRACLLYYQRACLRYSFSRLRIRFKGAGGHESGPAAVRGWLNCLCCDRILNRTEKSSTARSVDSQRRKTRPASPRIASSLSLISQSSEKFWARCPGALAVTRRVAP
jgi:hypothetical protein